MKKIGILSFFFILFLTTLHPRVYAQGTDTTQSGTSIETNPSDSNSVSFITDPKQENINDITPTVTVTFSGIENPGVDIYVCLRNDLCITNLLQFANLSSEKFNNLITATGVPKSYMDEEYLGKNKNILSNNSITVCGQNDDALKYVKDGKGCNPDKDYFWPGKFYLITAYIKQGGKYLGIARGGFFINHAAPHVTITPNSGLTPGSRFTVSLTQDKIRPGGKNRNNYEVMLAGPAIAGDGTKNECDWIDGTHNPRIFDFPQPDQPGNNHYTDPEQNSSDPDKKDLFVKGYIAPGKYKFKINEQNNEGHDQCSGGFTYWSINCTISNDSKVNNCAEPVLDPDKKDVNSFTKFLNALNNNEGKIPCKSGTAGVSSPLDCPEIDTAIGPIKVDVTGFIARLFSIVLSIAGLAAISLIIFSGYKLLISRGNKEMIQGARETLTAAIVGLLFIVLSLVILSVIGGDILKIPGFG